MSFLFGTIGSSVFSGLLHPTPSKLAVRKPLFAWKAGPDRKCRWAGVAVCLLISVLAMWDCRLRPASIAGCAPTTPGLQTETEKVRLRAGGGGLRASAHPYLPRVCSYSLPSEVRPGACFLTTPAPGNNLSQTRRNGGAWPGLPPRPPYSLSVCLNTF